EARRYPPPGPRPPPGQHRPHGLLHRLRPRLPGPGRPGADRPCPRRRPPDPARRPPRRPRRVADRPRPDRHRGARCQPRSGRRGGLPPRRCAARARFSPGAEAPRRRRPGDGPHRRYDAVRERDPRLGV
ncbi:MAG: hypothetical protein AVDCRST_MAG19-3559, partial [uncultured Thermomicrobiales bacterium]